jgi:hypothetical protein
MIRQNNPTGFFLIAQDDHARLSGELARRVGNAQVAAPARGESSILGIALHDCGWPLHDDHPLLDSHRLPRDVFETTPEVAFQVWSAGADIAAERDPYAGLLVSLHVLSLSVLAGASIGSVEELKAQRSFELNKFQHREIERQEELRQRIGLRIDRPLMHGLAEAGIDPAEDALRFDFRLLQALDQVSLALCGANPPNGWTAQVHPRPGEPARRLQLSPTGDGAWRVAPWLFNTPLIETTIEARHVPAGPYRDNEQFQQAYAAADRKRLTLRLQR